MSARVLGAAALVAVGGALGATQLASIAVGFGFLCAVFLALFTITALAGSGADAALSKEFPWQFRAAAACRTPVLMYIVIPLSFLQRLRVRCNRWMAGGTMSQGDDWRAAAARDHQGHVDHIVSQIKRWNEEGRQPKPLRTAS